jgi:drug/metabolite transporter (DMT)-like permease
MDLQPGGAPALRPSPALPAGVLGMAFVLLWSSGYPAARLALDHSAPFTLLVLRFGGAGLIFSALARLGGAAWPRGREALHSAAVGALQLALQFGALYFAAARGVNVGLIALVIGAMPILTALLGLGFFGEAVRGVQWLGFALGIGGVALAVGESLGAGRAGSPGAYLAVAAGLLAISVGTLYQKRHASHVDPRSGLALQHLTAAALLLPLAALEGFRVDPSPAFFGSLAWVIGVNSLSAFALFFVLLRRGAVNQVATLFFLMPPVTAVIDYFVLGDALTPYKVLGLALAALGVYLATRPRSRRRGGSARRARQLPARAERTAYEQASQLLAAVHPRERTLREARERAGAVGEQPIEGIDRRGHDGDLALAPALVGAQHPERPRILALRHRPQHQLRERCGIEQSQIHALPGERVHHVRGIPHQRHAPCDVARRRQAPQRERRALADEPRRPERQIRGAIELGSELAVAESGEVRRERLVRRPHDRARAVGERQEGERARAHEALPGGRVVRPRGGDAGDDGALAVAAHRGVEACRGAHRGLRAVGGDHQARREAARARADLDGAVGDPQGGEGGALQVPARVREGREQRPLQQAVLGDVTEVRLPDVGGIEYQHALARRRDTLVPHAHALIGRKPRPEQPPPRARALEDVLAGARQRDHARLERRVGGERRGHGGLDERDRQPPAAGAVRQQRRDAGTHRSAADHRHVKHG